MAVIKDIIDGSSLEITKKKRSKTLIYIITEVTGATTYAKETSALGAAGVPGISSKLGSMDCVSQSVKIVGPGEANITMRYETGSGAPQADPDNPDLPTYEVSTELRQESTPFLPADGTEDKEIIKVNYNDVDYTAYITVDFGVYMLRVSRVETGIDPGALALNVLNKVNSHTWQNGAPATWRCVSVTGTSTDAAVTWQMNYDFMYIPSGHQPIAVVINPDTSSPYEDAKTKPENGAREIVFYKKMNFADLNL